MSHVLNSARFRCRGIGPLCLSVLALACGGESPMGMLPPPPPPTFPALLSALNIDQPAAQLYAPQWELWTNGSVKERKVLLTQGGSIGSQNREQWDFPEGARFSKTFSYLTLSSPSQLVPVETRIILRTDGGWATAAYRWRPDLSDADLLSGDARVPVPVTLTDGTSFDHVIPSRADCQTCHGTRPAFILGFSELQLNSPLEGQAVTQLETLHQAGIFDRAMPADPFTIEADDATRAVLGYVHANCTHCHHASSTLVSLDLTHTVFLANTVDRPARNGQTLITPGDPDASYLFQLFRTGVMPLLGVQLGDEAGRTRLRDWILTHDFGN